MSARHPINRSAARTVWFHRQYQRFQGGHVKHAHYFDHVRRKPGFACRMVFTRATPSDSVERERLERERSDLWPLAADESAQCWQPQEHDLLFVAGTDWRYLAANGLQGLPNPRLNLIQHVRHADEGTELHGYLANKAIRICVSPEVADAVAATGRANGPVLTIVNGIALPPYDPAKSRGVRRRNEVTIIGYKRPALASALSRRLHEDGVAHRTVTEFLDRRAFLDLLAATEVAVCLPRAEEGFFLPALEAMAQGCRVVTLDCIGNRSFCLDGDNCLVAAPNADSLARQICIARGFCAAESESMLDRAAQTVVEHSLERERERFHEILRNVDQLWSDNTSVSVLRSPAPASVERKRPRKAQAPLVDFMIVGAQKCGTTALAHFLAQHPDIGMSRPKEPHLFDAPEFLPDDCTPRQLDERYAGNFAHCRDVALRGEATPIYLYLPDVAPALKRYNPNLKLIVLIRDPVARAISNYRMQKSRSREHLPFWLALLSEPFRLLREQDALAARSPSREHSYRGRGLYSLQLRNLYRYFPRDQVLIHRSEALMYDHDAVLREVFTFLGVRPGVAIQPRTVFPSGGGPSHPLSSRLLRLSYLAESRRLRNMLHADSRL